MNKKHVLLAASFLASASERLSLNGCNDWDWPVDWTEEERKEFATIMVSDNVGRNPEDFTEEDKQDVEELTKHGPPDWWVALVLGKILKKGAL